MDLAAQKGDLRGLKRLVKEGHSVNNLRDSLDRTPLVWAVVWGQTD